MTNASLTTEIGQFVWACNTDNVYIRAYVRIYVCTTYVAQGFHSILENARSCIWLNSHDYLRNIHTWTVLIQCVWPLALLFSTSVWMTYAWNYTLHLHSVYIVILPPALCLHVLPSISSFAHSDMSATALLQLRPGLNQTGLNWLGIIGGLNWQHEASLSGGATWGNAEIGGNTEGRVGNATQRNWAAVETYTWTPLIISQLYLQRSWSYSRGKVRNLYGSGVKENKDERTCKQMCFEWSERSSLKVLDNRWRPTVHWWIRTVEPEQMIFSSTWLDWMKWKRPWLPSSGWYVSLQ